MSSPVDPKRALVNAAILGALGFLSTFSVLWGVHGRAGILDDLVTAGLVGLIQFVLRLAFEYGLTRSSTKPQDFAAPWSPTAP